MKTKSPKTGCVEMVGPDVQMDQQGSSYEPANRLPIKCRHCSFPDLDFVSQPYLLTKGVSSPSEIAPAQVGNFLVRERVRQIFEIVVPQACAFYPTVDKKSGKQTDWWLAVPKRSLKVPNRKIARQPRCPECHEPKLGYTFADHAKYIANLKRFDTEGVDVFKARDWDSIGTAEDEFAGINRERKRQGMPPLSWKEYIHWAIPSLELPSHPGRWTRCHIGRNLYFSLRLEQLLKRAKVKGQLVRSYDFREVQTSQEEKEWIEERLQVLAKKGSGVAPTSAERAAALQKWFKQYLKRKGRKDLKPVNFAAVERRHKVTLPRDYKEYISAIGSRGYADVCAMEGASTSVLPPQKLDFKNYRRGQVPYLEGEDAQVDGVAFAEVDNGDVFVFDISTKLKDPPVYWYRHEENALEPFARSFTECIKQFVEGD